MPSAQYAPLQVTEWGTTLWVVAKAMTGSPDTIYYEMSSLRRQQARTWGQQRRKDICTIARPGDVLIRRWTDGKDGAIDVTVTSPLAASNVSDAAAKPGASLGKACARKKRETAEACRAEGLVFIPFAIETLGGFDTTATTQVKQLASALARSKGSDEREAASQLFGRLSLNLMRGNALMLASRAPDVDIPRAEVDGVQ